MRVMILKRMEISKRFPRRVQKVEGKGQNEVNWEVLNGVGVDGVGVIFPFFYAFFPFFYVNWEVLNGVGVDGVGVIFPFFLTHFSFFLRIFTHFFVFLRFSSLFFAFLFFS